METAQLKHRNPVLTAPYLAGAIILTLSILPQCKRKDDLNSQRSSATAPASPAPSSASSRAEGEGPATSHDKRACVFEPPGLLGGMRFGFSWDSLDLTQGGTLTESRFYMKYSRGRSPQLTIEYTITDANGKALSEREVLPRGAWRTMTWHLARAGTRLDVARVRNVEFLVKAASDDSPEVRLDGFSCPTSQPRSWTKTL